MSIVKRLESVARERKTILCLGLDPVPERIPVKDAGEAKQVLTFCTALLDRLGEQVAAVKPNSAFYEQLGPRGIDVLIEIVGKAKSMGLPVILDAKRGDIGRTAKAYAKYCFDVVDADMVTLSPFLGEDSVAPFLERFADGERGCYFLNRTSNKGAAQFQHLTSDGRYLYEHLTMAIADWHTRYGGSVGAVVGATAPEELDKITGLYEEKKAKVPLLIPGVGTQGGDPGKVIDILERRGLLGLARVNSSSGILYAHEKHPDMDWLDASAAEVERLRALLPYS